MITVLSTGVAAWVAWEAIRAVLPAPEWLKPFLMFGLCYGMLYAPAELLTTLHAAALVIALRFVVNEVVVPRVELPRPISFRPSKAKRGEKPSRLPDLP